MNKFTYSLLFFVLPFIGFSQSTNVTTAFYGNVKKADTYFNHFAYRNALNLYLHANEKDPEDHYIRERIGECYFKLHDPINAEKWFSELINEPDVSDEAKFEYAEALSMNGKYADSKFWFEEYLKAKPDDKLAKEKIAFLNKLHRYQHDSLRFVISGAVFNSIHSEYGAHYFHEGVVFASSRDVDSFVKHKPMDAVDEDESSLNLFYVDRKVTGEWGKVVHFHSEHIKSFLHEGPIAFSNNDNKGAFTRTLLKNGQAIYDENGRAHLGIYFADIDLLGSLSNITPFEHNSDSYSVAHPTLSTDGKTMYFSSSSPTGYGEADIYYSTFENDKWSDPINLGPGINTREDESFPFLANDSTLYFSSNGHGTLGGLDILVSYKKNGQFTKGQNFGGPLNSRFDDFSMVSDSTGRVGFFASNREGGKGLDDVYLFVANYYFLAGKVKELGDISPLSDAVVEVRNDKGELIDSVPIDEDGGFVLYLPFDQDFSLSAKKEGFESLGNEAFSTYGRPFGIDSLDLELWKKELYAKGKVFSNETESLLPGSSVILYSLADNKADTVLVNDKGEYSFQILPDKNYRVEARKEGYVTKGFDLDTKGIYKGELLNDIVLEEVFLEKNIIYFAFDKSDISSQSKQELDKVVSTLKSSSSATLNVGAYADSRGSKEYNKALSERRANSTVDYLVSKGVDRARIESQSFGEEFLVNECSDGVVCPERDHARNRRAEIKIQNSPIN